MLRSSNNSHNNSTVKHRSASSRSIQPALPFLLFGATIFGASVWLFYVCPALNLHSTLIAFLYVPTVVTLLAFYRAAWGADPGTPSREWTSWTGSNNSRPQTPEYAIVSSKWKEAYYDAKRQQQEQTVKQVLETSQRRQEVKVVKYRAGMIQHGQQMSVQPGVTLVNSDYDPFHGKIEWKSIGHQQCPPDDVKVEMTPLNNNVAALETKTSPFMSITMSPESMQAFAGTIQWGNEVDEQSKQKFLQSMIQFNTQGTGVLNLTSNAESVRSGPVEDVEEDKPLLDEFEEDMSQLYCKKHSCDNFRPPRTHHCSKCQRCVERMDHHCIWLNRCVGYGNHKPFVLFLIYFLTLDALYLVMSVILMITRRQIMEMSLFGVMHLISFFAGAGAMYGLSILLKVQIENMLSNCTEVEKIFHQPEFLIKYAKHSKVENLKVVLGDSIMKWFLPW